MKELLNTLTLENSIMATMVFFDIFDYPLTSWEVWKNLYGKKSSYYEVCEELDRLCSLGIFKTVCGFYFFPDRDEIIATRHARYSIAERKYRKALFAAKILSGIGGIKLIAVCNSLSFSNARSESDIDFFILAQEGRIWLIRLFSVSLMKLLGLRVSKETIQDKICLSFYATELGSAFQPLMLEDDICFAFWFSHLTPLFQKENAYEKVLEKNAWIYSFFPNFFPKKGTAKRFFSYSSRLTGDLVRQHGEECEKKYQKGNYAGHHGRKSVVRDSFFHHLWNIILREKFGEKLEHISFNIQMRLLPENLRSLSKSDTKNVIISDKVLKFHFNDRRRFVRNSWLETFKKYALSQKNH